MWIAYKLIRLMYIRDQQWIFVSLLISTHVILGMSEPAVLKFNCTLIHSYSVQHWFKSTGCNEYAYKWFEWFESFINIYSLCCYCIYKEWRKKKSKRASNTNIQPSTEYCSVRMWIILILCFVYMSNHEESKSATSCILLSLCRISTSNIKSMIFK